MNWVVYIKTLILSHGLLFPKLINAANIHYGLYRKNIAQLRRIIRML